MLLIKESRCSPSTQELYKQNAYLEFMNQEWVQENHENNHMDVNNSSQEKSSIEEEESLELTKRIFSIFIALSISLHPMTPHEIKNYDKRGKIQEFKNRVFLKQVYVHVIKLGSLWYLEFNDLSSLNCDRVFGRKKIF